MGVNPNSEPSIEINGLKFTYPGINGHPPPGSKPLIKYFNLTFNASDRCLLVGSNGAGKTTILKILGGKHMVEPHMVRVLGRSAFHDTALTGSGDLSYLGGEWRRDVAFAGFDVPIQMDVSADKLINGVAGIDPQRRAELIKVLDIDLSWRLHKVSDGQRRRVQICMGLLKPYKKVVGDGARAGVVGQGVAALFGAATAQDCSRPGSVAQGPAVLDKQHCCRRISRPRSTFSLDKQHCVEADWLSIQVSIEMDFRILIGRGHLISLLVEVRRYELLGSAH
ncbi:hypothetical protein ACFX1Q_030816 [Malus domestica]